MARSCRPRLAALVLLSCAVVAEASFGGTAKRYISYCLVCCFLMTSFVCGVLVLFFMIQKKMEAGADEEGDWPAPEAPKAPTSNNTQALASVPVVGCPGCQVRGAVRAWSPSTGRACVPWRPGGHGPGHGAAPRSTSWATSVCQQLHDASLAFELYQAASSFFAFTMSAGSSNGTVPPRLLRWTNEQLVGAMATAATATHPAALAAAASHAGGLLDLFLS
uniref:Uncharacterized protein n=1 Tax=Alexandrium monilatum TaxID=311494 RepID=A0A7S4S1Q7_9DINO|mmetsp:Transcript_97774/g.310081  ORF Transcript_97774/g.310081 Transcript_97774/m.310081 type:complete len:220 (-) Transcript_97774:128-787(-)